MNKNLRSLLFLVIIIVIPFLIYAYIQAKSLETDEKIADSIYEKQMETVLFSLNQYADDMMAHWIRRLSKEDEKISQNAFDLVLSNESIQMLVLRQIDHQKDSIFLGDYVELHSNTPAHINTWYQSKDSLIHQLTKYIHAGFQKIQSADDWVPVEGLRPQQLGITAMVYDRDSVLYNALFILEPNFWAEQLMGKKMREFAQNDFRLAVLQSLEQEENSNIIYSTSPFDLTKNYAKKDLWILSNTQLAIQPNGIGYAELIRKRSQNNLYILLFSVLVLLVGAYIILRNINNALTIAQLKSDFVSNVSHEIRTPLSLIRMYSETLMLGRLPTEEKKQQYYEVIHNEAGRLTYLVNNILDFSKIEANRKTYTMAEADLNQLLKQLLQQYSNTFADQNVTTKVEFSTTPLLVLIDQQALEVAFSNLIENAIKFSGEEKMITVRSHIKNGFAYCNIIDNGIGIPKNKQAKVFEKFYRVESALTQQTKGTGLGLSLVKHIIEAHKGSITIKSAPKQGSNFIVKLPLKPSHDA